MKKPTLILILVLSLATLTQVAFLLDSFPGFHSSSDCSLCHNEPATAYNETFMDSAITLDGEATEEFWVDDPWYREMRVPVATSRGGEELFVTMIFAQNATHLFIYSNWEDVLVDGNNLIRYGDADGFAIMWNVNGEDLPEDFFDGMKTNEPGQIVDNWIWKTGADAPSDVSGFNTTAGDKGLVDSNVLDTAFDDGGWDDDIDTSQDVMAAGTWGNQGSHSEQNYLMEMARPLITNDPGDVQFDKIGYYEFAIAIYNGTSAADHLISFEHSVFIYGVCETDCEAPIFTDHQTETVTENVTITEIKTEDAPISIIPVFFSLFTISTITLYIKRKS